MQTEDPCLEVHGTMHMCAWPSLHTSGWLSGPSNVSGLIDELQHDRVLMPNLQLTAWEGRAWEIRLSEGKQEGVPRAEPAGHSQGQSRLVGVSGFTLSKGNLTLAHHSGLAIARLPRMAP